VPSTRSTRAGTARTQEIRQDIERRRGDLGETLEALGDRMSPKKVAGRAKADVAEKLDEARARVNPGRLVRIGLDRAKSALGGDGERRPLPAPARPAASRRSPAARGQHDGSATGPLVAGAVAFGGGLAVASLLPSSPRERQLAGEVRQRIEPVKRQAVDAGRSVLHELQPAAQGRADAVRQRAADAAEELKRRAEQATEDVTAEGRQAGRRVRREAGAAAKTVKGRARRASGTDRAEAGTAPSTRRRRPSTSAAT